MRKAYPTDLTNAQWESIRAIIPAAVAKPGCEPTDLREHGERTWIIDYRTVDGGDSCHPSPRLCACI